jgi:hypothetical protein
MTDSRALGLNFDINTGKRAKFPSTNRGGSFVIVGQVLYYAQRQTMCGFSQEKSILDLSKFME